MRYSPTQDYSFLLDENHYVYDHVETEDSLHIYIKSKVHGCACPVCGKMNTTLYAIYKRKLQDTPIHCKRTYLHANVYKGASKVLALLGIQVSNDTIQRLYDRIEFVDNPNVEEIGVDDVAIRKGQTYATAIYDLKDHHLLALPDERDGAPLKKWLKSHNKVRLVARDRASAYAAAINEVLPDCVQVADRFHLLQNLLEYMKDIFKEKMPPKLYMQGGNIDEKEPEKILKEKVPDEALLNSLHYDNTPPVDSDGNEAIYDNKKHNLNSKQYQRQEEARKKTAIDQGYTRVLERPGETANKTCGRNFRDIAADSEGLHFYDRRRHLWPGQSHQLQETRIPHEGMAECYL